MCEHELLDIGGIGVVACGDCGTCDWWGSDGRVAPADALDRLFGTLELVGRLPAVGAPARHVFAYRAATRRERANLAAFPTARWLRADPHLWMSTDGDMLLLAPTDPSVARRLGRGAS